MLDLTLRCARCNAVPATLFLNGASVCQACAHAAIDEASPPTGSRSVTVAERDRSDERALVAALREVGPVPRRLLRSLSGVPFQRATAAIDRMLAEGRLEMRKGMLALAGTSDHIDAKPHADREPLIAMA